MLKVKELTVIKEKKTILESLDLEVEKGEKLVILGESGSGKSTLLKSLLFFEVPSKGEIYYHNTSLDASNIGRIRKECVYIGQKAPIYLDNVEDYIYLPFHYRLNRQLKPDRKTVISELRNYAISKDILTQEYNDLSGGEQQRITIIRALLLNRPLYLLDEITSSLDTSNVEKVILNILADPERTLIYVTHNPRYLDRFSRVLYLENGSLINWSTS